MRYVLSYECANVAKISVCVQINSFTNILKSYILKYFIVFYSNKIIMNSTVVYLFKKLYANFYSMLNFYLKKKEERNVILYSKLTVNKRFFGRVLGLHIIHVNVIEERKTCT